MSEIYGLVIKRDKHENYGFPMPLEQIDYLTTTNKIEDLLERVKESNIIPDFPFTNPTLAIAKLRNNKWVIDKHFPIITDPLILNYHLEEIFKDEERVEPYLNTLYNRLSPLLLKKHPSIELKNAIKNLKISKSAFLDAYSKLDYPDKRQIKSVFSQIFPIENLNKPLETLELKRTKEETKAA